MTPEQAAQFEEKCEQEFKDRYSSEDKSYRQITSQPQTQPPLVISQPRPDDQEQRRYPAEPPLVQIDTNLEDNPMIREYMSMRENQFKTAMVEKVEANLEARVRKELEEQGILDPNDDINGEGIPFFRQSHSPIAGDLVVDQRYRSQKHSPIWPIYSVPSAITPPVVNPKKEKLTKMKQRKEARKEREEKKVKTVIADDRETPYDFEKVLQELGDVDSNKKAANSNNSGAKGKKAKVEAKKEIANQQKYLLSDIFYERNRPTWASASLNRVYIIPRE